MKHRLEDRYPFTIADTDEISEVAIRLGLDDMVQEALRRQSWYRKYANTINTAIGAAVTVAASLAASGMELPVWATYAVAVVGAVGTILGVRNTHNGIPQDTASRLCG